MRIEQVHDDNKAESAQLVASWGYPRTIPTDERDKALWVIALEDSAVLGFVWFLQCGESPNVFAHVCSDPEINLSKSQIFFAEVMVQVVAGLLGAHRVYAPLKDVKHPMRRYLRNRGWKEDTLGSYIELGGNHG